MPPLLPSSLLVLGATLLIHAAYSANEHSALVASTTLSTSTPTHDSNSTTPLTPTAAPSTSLPLDIALETLVSALLLCIGIVLSSDRLQPIEWRVWAAAVDHGSDSSLPTPTSGAKGVIEEDGAAMGKAMGNGARGYAWLDQGNRRGFVDIRHERREFADWVREGGR